MEAVEATGENMVSTTFGTSATSISDATPPFSGEFQPQEAFPGSDALTGTWVVRVYDDAAGASGRLNGVSIHGSEEDP